MVFFKVGMALYSFLGFLWGIFKLKQIKIWLFRVQKHNPWLLKY